MVCDTPDNNITLNVYNISVEETLVQKVNGEQLENMTITNSEYDLERDFFIVTLSETLQTDQTYRITMKYKGRLQDDLAGYYHSSYVEDGETRSVLVYLFPGYKTS